jgi:hypothetical protein
LNKVIVDDGKKIIISIFFKKNHFLINIIVDDGEKKKLISKFKKKSFFGIKKKLFCQCGN